MLCGALSSVGFSWVSLLWMIFITSLHLTVYPPCHPNTADYHTTSSLPNPKFYCISSSLPNPKAYYISSSLPNPEAYCISSSLPNPTTFCISSSFLPSPSLLHIHYSTTLWYLVTELQSSVYRTGDGSDELVGETATASWAFHTQPWQ